MSGSRAGCGGGPGGSGGSDSSGSLGAVVGGDGVIGVVGGDVACDAGGVDDADVGCACEGA